MGLALVGLVPLHKLADVIVLEVPVAPLVLVVPVVLVRLEDNCW